MAKYYVRCYETVFSIIEVKASSREEAKSKAWDILSESGTPSEAKVTNREFDATYVEEQKQC